MARLVILLALLPACLLAASTCAPSPDCDTSCSIQKRQDEFKRLFTQGEMEILVEMFMPDAVLSMQDGPRESRKTSEVKGTAEILKFYKSERTRGVKGINIMRLSFEQLDGSVREWGTFDLILASGERTPGVYDQIWAQDKDCKWKIVRDQSKVQDFTDLL